MAGHAHLQLGLVALAKRRLLFVWQRVVAGRLGAGRYAGMPGAAILKLDFSGIDRRLLDFELSESRGERAEKDRARGSDAPQ